MRDDAGAWGLAVSIAVVLLILLVLGLAGGLLGLPGAP